MSYEDDLKAGIGPDFTTVDCVIYDESTAEKGFPVCTLDMYSKSKRATYIEVEISLGEQKFNLELDGGLYPGEHLTRVIKLGDNIKPTNQLEECTIKVIDAFGRAFCDVSGNIFLGDKETYASNMESEIEIMDSLECDGETVSVASLTFRSEKEEPVIVKIISDSVPINSYPITLRPGLQSKGIQMLTSRLPKTDKADIQIQIFRKDQLILEKSKTVKIVRTKQTGSKPIDPESKKKTNTDVSADFKIVDKCLDVHDSDDGMVKVGTLIIESASKTPSMVNAKICLYHEMPDSNDIQISSLKPITLYSNNFQVSSLKPVNLMITVPEHTLYYDDDFNGKFEIDISDGDDEPFIVLHRGCDIRSKYDLNLRRQKELFPKFVNPLSKVSNDIVNKTVKDKKIQITAYLAPFNGAIKQTQAIYETIQSYGMTYRNDAKGYDERNQGRHFQRVRSPERILKEGNFNCADISVLFASVIERAGLEPVLISLDEHMIAGVVVKSDAPFTDVRGDAICMPDKLKDYVREFKTDGGYTIKYLPFEGTYVGYKTIFDSAVEEGAKQVDDNLRDNYKIWVYYIPEYRNKGVKPYTLDKME